jgi:hypothetical protein
MYIVGLGLPDYVSVLERLTFRIARFQLSKSMNFLLSTIFLKKFFLVFFFLSSFNKILLRILTHSVRVHLVANQSLKRSRYRKP